MKSPMGFVAGLLRRAQPRAEVEILPPDRRPAAPEWDLSLSAEERAGAFASLFLEASPKDMRSSRFADFKEQ